MLTLKVIQVSWRLTFLSGTHGYITKPRPILVKFLSRRSKACIMRQRKKLRALHPTTRRADLSAPITEQPDPDADALAPRSTDTQFPNPVFVEDDLTQRRSKLAFHARQLRRDNIIDNTWIFDTRIMIKDLRGNISEIKAEGDIEKLRRRST